MQILVPNETRFLVNENGQVLTSGPTTYRFWQRYLDVFDEVVIVARARSVDRPEEGMHEVTGVGVRLEPIPWYIGPRAYIRHWWNIRQSVRKAMVPEAAVVLRAPGRMAQLAAGALPATRPFGVEIVADPYGVFAPGANTHPLRPFFRWSGTRATRELAQAACAVAYVSNSSLPDRYPAALSAYSTTYSSIELDSEHLIPATAMRSYSGDPVIVTMGSLAQPYKGVDLLIDAAAKLSQQIPNLSVRILGDGIYRGALEEQVRQLGVSGRVEFLGHVPSGAAVRAELDKASLFVLASRTEGLPRAMIEAMARGLPCIGTTVGGIPELLPPEDMVPPNNAKALANKIAAVLEDPVRMQEMSARNLTTAALYRDDVLHERRVKFYRTVREQTEAWLRAQSGDALKIC